MDTAFRRAVAEARQDGGLYFASLLSEERIIGSKPVITLPWAVAYHTTSFSPV